MTIRPQQSEHVVNGIATTPKLHLKSYAEMLLISIEKIKSVRFKFLDIHHTAMA